RPDLAHRLPIVLTASGAIAAGSSVLLSRGIAPAAALARFERIGYRISGHVADVNAAGSYFVMIACVALGMALRERGTRRGMWCGGAAAAVVGLWLTRSQTALAVGGVVIPIAIAWVFASRWTLTKRLAVFAMVLAVGIGVGAVRAYWIRGATLYRGAGMREQFNATSVRMIAARPLAGIGVGQYLPMSPLF